MEENKNEVAVSAPEVTILSDRHSRAVTLDESIKSHAQIAQQSLYEVCKGLKEMRDGKLYKELGYQTFEKYCKDEVGFERRQVYRFISIAENLPKDFVTSMSQIGATKLALLATLEPEQRDELAQNVELETASTRDIEKEIKVIKAQHKADIEVIKKQHQEVLDRQKSKYETNIQEQHEMLEQAQRTCENYRERMKKAKEKAENLTGHIIDLERQIQEFESAPKDVRVAVPVEITEQLQELTNTKEELEQKKASLEAELQEAKKREQEAKVEAEKLQEVNAETVAESQKQIEELQVKIAELENQSSVSGAEPDVKELFKPYFQNCMNSINLMFDFIVKHKQESDFNFLITKAEQTAKVIVEQLQLLKK